jgi:hypothetical protein
MGRAPLLVPLGCDGGHFQLSDVYALAVGAPYRIVA